MEPLLPEQTGDDEGLVDARGDDWYIEERPPHHG
jgi:hypothetical protein